MTEPNKDGQCESDRQTGTDGENEGRVDGRAGEPVDERTGAVTEWAHVGVVARIVVTRDPDCSSIVRSCQS